jgi:hypothetical protein
MSSMLDNEAVKLTLDGLRTLFLQDLTQADDTTVLTFDDNYGMTLDMLLYECNDFIRKNNLKTDVRVQSYYNRYYKYKLDTHTMGEFQKISTLINPLKQSILSILFRLKSVLSIMYQDNLITTHAFKMLYVHDLIEEYKKLLGEIPRIHTVGSVSSFSPSMSGSIDFGEANAHDIAHHKTRKSSNSFFSTPPDSPKIEGGKPKPKSKSKALKKRTECKHKTKASSSWVKTNKKYHSINNKTGKSTNKVVWYNASKKQYGVKCRGTDGCYRYKKVQV